MKLDLATAYAASLARVASWAIVAGVVYRFGGSMELAVLMLARGTVGLLTYASMGLVPALLSRFAAPQPVIPLAASPAGQPLAYAHPGVSVGRGDPDERRSLYNATVSVVFLVCLACLVPAALYAANFGEIHELPSQMQIGRGQGIAFALASGVLFRAWSDVAGAWLAATGALWKDNLIIVLGEMLFLGIVLVTAREIHPAQPAAAAFLCGSLLVAAARFWLARPGGNSLPVRMEFRRVWPVLTAGALVLLSQFADFLYAPVNQIIISRTLDTSLVAAYAPALQIDAALLLIVSGLASVLLPRTVLSHAAGDVAAVRRYYIRGSLTSLGALMLGAALVVLLREPILLAWFKDPMPLTQAILPLVMIHTVIGGTAAIGRSVLLGIGRIKAYAISALLGGVANVVLAIAFVTLTDLGLKGIVLATVITVTVRCALWMPWYTLRALRANAPLPATHEPAD